MSIKFRLNKPIRKPAHWSKERYKKYLENYKKKGENKMIRVEIFVDNKREGLIRLEATKGFISIIKDWLDRQTITELEVEKEK